MDLKVIAFHFYLSFMQQPVCFLEMGLYLNSVGTSLAFLYFSLSSSSPSVFLIAETL